MECTNAVSEGIKAETGNLLSFTSFAQVSDLVQYICASWFSYFTTRFQCACAKKRQSAICHTYVKRVFGPFLQHGGECILRLKEASFNRHVSLTSLNTIEYYYDVEITDTIINY